MQCEPLIGDVHYEYIVNASQITTFYRLAKWISCYLQYIRVNLLAFAFYLQRFGQLSGSKNMYLVVVVEVVVEIVYGESVTDTNRDKYIYIAIVICYLLLKISYKRVFLCLFVGSLNLCHPTDLVSILSNAL